jgi:hypothetical protein
MLENRRAPPLPLAFDYLRILGCVILPHHAYRNHITADQFDAVYASCVRIALSDNAVESIVHASPAAKRIRLSRGPAPTSAEAVEATIVIAHLLLCAPTQQHTRDMLSDYVDIMRRHPSENAGHLHLCIGINYALACNILDIPSDNVRV